MVRPNDGDTSSYKLRTTLPPDRKPGVPADAEDARNPTKAKPERQTQGASLRRNEVPLRTAPEPEAQEIARVRNIRTLANTVPVAKRRRRYEAHEHSARGDTHIGEA